MNFPFWKTAPRTGPRSNSCTGVHKSNVGPLKNIPFWPISASDSDFNPRHTQCMPPVKIFAFLDLDQNWTFFKGPIFHLPDWVASDGSINYWKTWRFFQTEELTSRRNSPICSILAELQLFRFAEIHKQNYLTIENLDSRLAGWPVERVVSFSPLSTWFEWYAVRDYP